MKHAAFDSILLPDLPPEHESWPEVRFLGPHDLPALLELERVKWDDEQAASRADLASRIAAYPGLSVAAFCPRTGCMLASLFMRPVETDFWQRAASRKDCVEQPVPERSNSLFGISLSSREAGCVEALLEFFWPHALKRGWSHIYLGSPVPGLRDWWRHHPHGSVEGYVKRRRGGLPADPQLRYYHSRGFREIVCVKPGYFPHARSLDHRVILRGSMPLSPLPVWRVLPIESTRRLTGQFIRLL